jgi:hypothetical protein
VQPPCPRLGVCHDSSVLTAVGQRRQCGLCNAHACQVEYAVAVIHTLVQGSDICGKGLLRFPAAVLYGGESCTSSAETCMDEVQQTHAQMTTAQACTTLQLQCSYITYVVLCSSSKNSKAHHWVCCVSHECDAALAKAATCPPAARQHQCCFESHSQGM